MQSAKQKVSNIASAAKEKIEIAKAKVEEEAQSATARTREEKQIATEVRKVKEAEAKANLHTSKAKHAADKLETKQAGHHYNMPGRPATGIVTGVGSHVPVTTGHQTFGAAGNIPPGTGTTITHNHHANPLPFNRHL